MSFPLSVDRGVCNFLTTVDFMSLRTICKTHYYDKEAYDYFYQDQVHICIPKFSVRQKIGLNYLLTWALELNAPIGSHNWFQMIVNWLTYRSSIKIMYKFLFHFCRRFLLEMDLSSINTASRFIWMRLTHRNSRLFKRLALDYDYNDRPTKMVRRSPTMYRDIFACC